MGRRLIATGAHSKLISTRLGHSSISITMNRYGHLLPSVDDALAGALDAACRSAAPPSSAAMGPCPLVPGGEQPSADNLLCPIEGSTVRVR